MKNTASSSEGAVLDYERLKAFAGADHSHIRLAGLWAFTECTMPMRM